jgi:hypothetical protein
MQFTYGSLVKDDHSAGLTCLSVRRKLNRVLRLMAYAAVRGLALLALPALASGVHQNACRASFAGVHYALLASFTSVFITRMLARHRSRLLMHGYSTAGTAQLVRRLQSQPALLRSAKCK